MAAVLFDEISQRANQVVDFIAGKTFAKIFDASGSLIKLGHDGIEVGLFRSGYHLVVLQGRRVR